MSYARALCDRWRQDPARVVTPDRTLDATTWDDRLGRAAAWLDARGVAPGDRVVLQLGRTPALLELHLALLHRGACTVPVNPRATPAEVAHVLATARPVLAVLPEAVHDALDPRPPGPSAEALETSLDASPARRLDDDPVPDVEAEALLLFTSGTTGAPKGVPIRHRQLHAQVTVLHDAWRFTPDDVLLHVLPLFHVHGLIVAQHTALWAGATTHWCADRSPAGIAEALAATRATVFMAVPTIWHRLIALPELPPLDHLRLATSGSAPLAAADHEAFEARTGHRILERYGMTEIGIVLAHPYDGPRVPGSVGVPLPGVDLRIVDPDHGDEVPQGAVGELVIRAPTVMDGYLDRPEATAAVLEDGWMHTGDLGHRDAEGRVWLKGRRGDLVLVGGFNVYPAEVERVMCTVDGVAEAAVVGVPDPDLGERVCATVVPAPGAQVDLDAVRAACAAALSAYKVPRALALAEDLPRNPMGKVQRSRVREAWMRVQVRDATPDEADRIAAWNVALAAETEDLALDPDVVASGVRHAFDRPDARYLTACVAGVAVGQAMLTTEWSDWRDREVWWLQSVYVPPDRRGQGVFRAIYDHVRASVRASGAGGLRLYVDRRNTRARDVYAHLGMDGEHYELMEWMLP